MSDSDPRPRKADIGGKLGVGRKVLATPKPLRFMADDRQVTLVES
jgi:hypothetical protein